MSVTDKGSWDLEEIKGTYSQMESALHSWVDSGWQAFLNASVEPSLAEGAPTTYLKDLYDVRNPSSIASRLNAFDETSDSGETTHWTAFLTDVQGCFQHAPSLSSLGSYYLLGSIGDLIAGSTGRKTRDKAGTYFSILDVLGLLNGIQMGLFSGVVYTHMFMMHEFSKNFDLDEFMSKVAVFLNQGNVGV
jgi:hypothetical protein